MKKPIDQRERAKRAWDILTELARDNLYATYGGLGSRMHVHPRTCRFFSGGAHDHGIRLAMNPDGQGSSRIRSRVCSFPSWNKTAKAITSSLTVLRTHFL
jgi:hypothetical protein